MALISSTTPALGANGWRCVDLDKWESLIRRDLPEFERLLPAIWTD
jgi:hypothetical protein